MEQRIRIILQEFSTDLQKIFQEELRDVILYGSYARGDNTEFSDIDIMVLVSTNPEKIHTYYDAVSDLVFCYLMQYGVSISPVIKNKSHFVDWVDNLPFYRNIRNEGVAIHAG